MRDTTNLSITMSASRRAADHSERKVALAAALGLLFMALLAPFARFGVLQTLIVPADVAATVTNIIGSAGLFRAAIAAFLLVAILDVVVAWALYMLLRPVNEGLALLCRMATSGLRRGLRVRGGQPLRRRTAPSAARRPCHRRSSAHRWHRHLPHSQTVGTWRSRSSACTWSASGSCCSGPRPSQEFLGALVVLAGSGYLADSFGRILVPGYTLTISVVTFLGEALLIVWLFWIAIKGTRVAERPRLPAESPRSSGPRRVRQPTR